MAKKVNKKKLPVKKKVIKKIQKKKVVKKVVAKKKVKKPAKKDKNIFQKAKAVIDISKEEFEYFMTKIAAI